MAKPLVIAIKHRVGKAEAQKRMREAVGWFKSHYGSAVTLTDETWTEDTATFNAGGLGYAVPCTMAFTPTEVTLSAELPWLLGTMIAPFTDTLTKKAEAFLNT